MTIIRTLHDKEHPFVMVARGVAQNHTLSYEALGLLTYLLSKPDDWTVVPEDLMRPGCKRDKVYKLLNELKDAGHITHVRVEAAHNVPPMWGERIVNEAPNPEKPETATEQAETLPFTPLPDTATAGYGERHIRQNDANKQESKDNKQEIKQIHTTRAREARKSFDSVPKDDRLQIIRAWAESLSIEPIKPYNKDANHSAAAEIFEAGYRAHHVALFVKAKMLDDYWHGKTLTLAKVGELMPLWLVSQSKVGANGNGKHAPNGNGKHPPPLAAPSTSGGVAELKRQAELAKQQGGK